MFWKKKVTEKCYPDLGEVYMYSPSYPYYCRRAAHSTEWIEEEQKPVFVSFKESDIGDRHDEYVEIFGVFHKKENVFYYDEVYSSLRNKIIKRNTK